MIYPVTVQCQNGGVRMLNIEVEYLCVHITILTSVLGWDDVDVYDVIVMDVCCVCTWRGVMIMFDIPGGGNRVVKEF